MPPNVSQRELASLLKSQKVVSRVTPHGAFLRKKPSDLVEGFRLSSVHVHTRGTKNDSHETLKFLNERVTKYPQDIKMTISED